MHKLFLVMCMLGCSTSALAGSYCYSETVTSLIIQNNTVYFTTDKSCPSWCAIPSTWGAAMQSQAYAMLISARTTGPPVSFYWNDQSSSCSNIEAVGSSPTTLVF
jgi:hypothetical protein